MVKMLLGVRVKNEIWSHSKGLQLMILDLYILKIQRKLTLDFILAQEQQQNMESAGPIL